jgi:hypothetical protein
MEKAILIAESWNEELSYTILMAEIWKGTYLLHYYN